MLVCVFISDGGLVVLLMLSSSGLVVLLMLSWSALADLQRVCAGCVCRVCR